MVALSTAEAERIEDQMNPQIAVAEVTSWDSESVEMEAKAKEVCATLCRHYPAHPWIVGWAPGMTLVVKHMAGDCRYGYTIDGCKTFSASDLARAAVNAGGELLERMGLARAKWNGDMGQKYEQ